MLLSPQGFIVFKIEVISANHRTRNIFSDNNPPIERAEASGEAGGSAPINPGEQKEKAGEDPRRIRIKTDPFPGRYTPPVASGPGIRTVTEVDGYVALPTTISWRRRWE